jgi:mannose-binding lectin 2
MKFRILQALAGLLFAATAHGDMDVPASRDDGFQTVPLRTHSLFMPYTEAHLQNRWWDFGADTIVRQGEYIRLTSDRPSQQGYIFSRLPITATNWEVEVTFRISGNGHLFGDGMAMWVTKQRAQVGPVFGHTDNFEGLAIFIDTYKNSRLGVTFPYVMAMVGDGKTQYDSGSDGKDQELGGCSARGLRNKEGAARMRVTYLADQELTVDLMHPEEDNWRACFSIPSPKLPHAAYLGFSAETGELSDNHDILSSSSKNLYAPQTPGHSGSGNSKPNMGSSKGDYNYGTEQKKGSWLWSFVKLVFFLAIIAGAYIGFTAWRMQQKRSRF